ncbi:MAG: hypothetical protein A3A65_04855 [Candidatus Chisholmbacteria bacterium RIFCSPLOWO2_01_FULL_49_14]|uniref:Polysaccharide pyruvyl transferase domain-containing protein n=1 Tax=Candidatus Chisholmbacteria bacterium RIFCSPLOWO2_01_FULL_49_14 TaxID=1797593 RepID=A0A1G1W4B7_9BACT|nr:MAG: hypothetical protein A3A65_04855 [Candidatus Chisholmbacteria bacterium RIFCSPLOWO2_01_FULL_49_14]
MKVLIPNAAKPGNLGDMAILNVLLARLRSRKNTIMIHCFNPEEQKKEMLSKPCLYYWAAFQTRSNIHRLTRTLILAIGLLMPERFEKILPRDLQLILSDYKTADQIVLQGGGYFRSKKGLRQQINAVMNAIFILFAKKYRKPVTIRPMSFGPFSNTYTEWLCGTLISLADTIYIRDGVSYDVIAKYIPAARLMRAPDDALSLKPVKVKKHSQRTLGFTIREWVNIKDREIFLSRFADFIHRTAEDQRCSIIQPIIQADLPEYGEGDRLITARLVKLLEGKGLRITRQRCPKTVNQALASYGKLSYLIGMRMHSCIFAHVQGIPFTAIAYEHKHSLLKTTKNQVKSLAALGTKV